MSRTLSISPDIRPASSWIARASSARAGASMRSPRSSRLDEAPTIEASGVRRSCEIAASRALRSRSDSAESSLALAAAPSCARSSASAIWLAKVSSSRCCSGTNRRRGFAGRIAATPISVRLPGSGR